MSAPAWDDNVPPQLAARMNELLRTHAGQNRDTGALVDAAIAALDALIARPIAEQSALDLLAIDGLTTAAFESTLSEEQLDALAEHGTTRLMALGDSPA